LNLRDVADAYALVIAQIASFEPDVIFNFH
jgi:hypothetical protein